MNKNLARILFRTWPFTFGHVRIMNWLSPPDIDSPQCVSKIRGYHVRLKYNPNTYIGRYLYYRGIFEEQIIRKIANVTRPGMTFLDIGANIGLHTNVVASLVGRDGRVIAVEPLSTVRALLIENIALNGFENVQIIDSALGREESEGEIFIVNENNDGQSTLKPECDSAAYPSEKINISRLDSVMSDLDILKADVVKIDVEGAEMEVLGGGERFLGRSPPAYIFIECVDHHLRRFGSSSEELVAWLQSHGYNTFGLIRGRWKKVAPIANMDIDLMAVSRDVVDSRVNIR